MMRKDYELLAEHLRKGKRRCNCGEEEYGYEIAISVIADALQSDNARFDRDKFRKAVNENHKSI